MYEGQTGGIAVGFSVGAEIPSLARGAKTDTENTQSPVQWRRGSFEVKASSLAANPTRATDSGVNKPSAPPAT